ncbi:hypothetical protein P3T34_002355 [Kitasatospora sp. MAP12-44]|nr:hypothetical protein [Kitasatospora sp. MAP12-44]
MAKALTVPLKASIRISSPLGRTSSTKEELNPAPSGCVTAVNSRLPSARRLSVQLSGPGLSGSERQNAQLVTSLAAAACCTLSWMVEAPWPSS